MTLFLVLTIIFLILFLDQRNQNTILRRQINRLQKRIDELSSPEVRAEMVVENIKTKIEETKENIIEKISDLTHHKDNRVNEALKEKNMKERKITWILSTGVILVLLAAVVFMVSTWAMIPNFVKTLVLVATAGVFYAAGGVSKKILNLEKTSFAFTILGNLYLPISLVSISFFGLIGDYFSIGGVGQSLYFAVVCLISSLVYLYTLKIYDNKFLTWLLMLADLGIVISIVSFFTNNINVIYLTLILYNLICMLVFNNVKVDSDVLNRIKREEMNFMNIVMFILVFLSVFNFSGDKLFYGVNIVLASFMFLLNSLYRDDDAYDYLFCLFFVFGLVKWFGDIITGNVKFLSFALVAPLLVMISKLFAGNKKRTERYNIFTYLGATFTFIITAFYFVFNLVAIDAYAILSFLFITLTYLYLTMRDGSIFCAISSVLSVIVTGYIVCKLPILALGTMATTNWITILMMALFLGLFMFNKNEKLSVLKTGTAFVACFFMPYMYLFQKVMVWDNIIPSYVFLIMTLLVFYGVYNGLKKENDSRAFLRAMIPVTVGLILVDFLSVVAGEVGVLQFGLIGLFLFALSLTNFIRKNYISEIYFIVSHVWVGISLVWFGLTYLTGIMDRTYYLIENISILGTIVYYLGLIFMYIYSLLKVEDKSIRNLFKIICFVVFNLSILSVICWTGNYEFVKYTIAISTAIIFAIMIGFKLFNSKFLMNYITISVALNFFLLFSDIGLAEYIILLASAYLMLVCCYKNIKNIKYDCLPLVIITFLNIFETQYIFKENSTAVLITIANVLAMLASQVPLYKAGLRKSNSFAGIIPVASILFLEVDNPSNLLAVSLIQPLAFFIWNLFNMNYIENKKGYKTIFTLALLWPYYIVLNQIDNLGIFLPVLKYMPVLLVTIALTRKVLAEYKELRFIEYIIQFVIYGAILLSSADDFAKGIVFGAVLFIMILLSSNLNYGAIFAGSIVALLVAVFLQTLGFWMSIPWWLYLLVVGAGMIAFAMRNEIIRNKEENNSAVSEWIEKLKEKMKD